MLNAGNDGHETGYKSPGAGFEKVSVDELDESNNISSY